MKQNPTLPCLALWLAFGFLGACSLDALEEDNFVYKPAPQSVPTSGVAPAEEDEIPPGSEVILLDVLEGDAFYEQRESLRGKVCYVRGEGLWAEEEEGVYRGSLRCGYEPDYFFTHVKVGLVAKKEFAPPRVEGEAFSGEEIPPGKKVKILAFSPEDALFPWPEELRSRRDELLRRYGSLLGEVCEVAPETPLTAMLPKSQPGQGEAKPRGLVRTGDDWYGGALLCKDQKKIFVYQAAFEVL